MYPFIITPTASSDSSPTFTVPSATSCDCRLKYDDKDMDSSPIQPASEVLSLILDISLSSQLLDNTDISSLLPKPSTACYHLPLTESTFNTSPDQLRTLNLLLTTIPTIPPLMANIPATPEDYLLLHISLTIPNFLLRISLD